MQAESLEILENAKVAPEQARAIVRAIEVEIAGARDTLATKSDLVLLRQDVRGAMSELRGDRRGEMSELRGDLRGEMSELRVELKGDLAKLQAQIHESASGVTRQMYMALLGQMAVLLGFGYFFAVHVR
jgi:hypothetical protein